VDPTTSAGNPARRSVLRLAWIVLLFLAVAVIATGCGGSGSETSSTSTSSTSSSVTPASGEEEDLTRRWGPEEQPDMNAEPLQFLHWRVDAMFDRDDIDADGRMDLDEFAGEAYNFERMDANGDGFLTKKEVVDDMIPVLRAEGQIP
jgi:hypothetical protein